MTEDEQQEPNPSGEIPASATKRKTAARKTARKAATKKSESARTRTAATTEDAERGAASPPSDAPEGARAAAHGKAPESSAKVSNGPIRRPDAEIPARYSTDDDPDWSASARTERNRSEHREAAHGQREQERSAQREPSHGQGEQRRPEQAGRPHGEGDPGSEDGRRDERSHGGHRQQQQQQQRQNPQGGWKQKNKNFKQRFKKPQQGGGFHQHQAQGGPQKSKKKKRKSRQQDSFYGPDTGPEIEIGFLGEYDLLENLEQMTRIAEEHSGGGEPVLLNELAQMPLLELVKLAREGFEIELETAPKRQTLIENILEKAFAANRAIRVEGIVETTEEGYGLLVYQHDNYKIRPLNAFVSEELVQRYGLKRGQMVEAQVHPSRDGETCPYLLRILSIMGDDPEANLSVIPFEDLVPYYPTERIILETTNEVKWDNLSMRIVDLLTPVGQGQRGLIVAPPRTGKTVLQQGIANAIATNYPDVHLIVLLVDERPEEVTDFRRQIKSGEVIASTFDQDAESHVHCAEMVIEKARRLVERGQHVAILLDSITRLARAYNALASNSGKILSGGVEATALQKPKRFFGSARNIEGAGSLTILGTALVDTGSRMDEVIFEEFKGTGNMELHLDRGLVDKRVFPAIGLDRSGTRKEELLYHPDELLKVYGLRRAMKGVPSTEAMEMLITRVKKTKTNVEFLMGLNR